MSASKSDVLVIMNISNGKAADSITIRRGDNPLALAQAFVDKHNLPGAKVVRRLATKIQQQIDMCIDEESSAATSKSPTKSATSPTKRSPGRSPALAHRTNSPRSDQTNVRPNPSVSSRRSPSPPKSGSPQKQRSPGINGSPSSSSSMARGSPRQPQADPSEAAYNRAMTQWTKTFGETTPRADGQGQNSLGRAPSSAPPARSTSPSGSRRSPKVAPMPIHAEPTSTVRSPRDGPYDDLDRAIDGLDAAASRRGEAMDARRRSAGDAPLRRSRSASSSNASRMGRVEARRQKAFERLHRDAEAYEDDKRRLRRSVDREQQEALDKSRFKPPPSHNAKFKAKSARTDDVVPEHGGPGGRRPPQNVGQRLYEQHSRWVEKKEQKTDRVRREERGKVEAAMSEVTFAPQLATEGRMRGGAGGSSSTRARSRDASVASGVTGRWSDPRGTLSSMPGGPDSRPEGDVYEALYASRSFYAMSRECAAKTIRSEEDAENTFQPKLEARSRTDKLAAKRRGIREGFEDSVGTPGSDAPAMSQLTPSHRRRSVSAERRAFSPSATPAASSPLMSPGAQSLASSRGSRASPTKVGSISVKRAYTFDDTRAEHQTVPSKNSVEFQAAVEANVAHLMQAHQDKMNQVDEARAHHQRQHAEQLDEETRSQFFRERDAGIAEKRQQQFVESRDKASRAKDTRYGVPGAEPGTLTTSPLRSPEKRVAVGGMFHRGESEPDFFDMGMSATTPQKGGVAETLTPASVASSLASPQKRQLNALTTDIELLGTDAIAVTPGGTRAKDPPAQEGEEQQEMEEPDVRELTASASERTKSISMKTRRKAVSLSPTSTIGETTSISVEEAAAAVVKKQLELAASKEKELMSLEEEQEEGHGVEERGRLMLSTLDTTDDKEESQNDSGTAERKLPPKKKKTIFDTLYEDKVYEQAKRQALVDFHTEDYLAGFKERVGTGHSQDFVEDVVERLSEPRVDKSKVEALEEEIYKKDTADLKARVSQVPAARIEQAFEKLGREDLERRAQVRKEGEKAVIRDLAKKRSHTIKPDAHSNALATRARRRVLSEIFDVLLASTDFRKDTKEAAAAEERVRAHALRSPSPKRATCSSPTAAAVRVAEPESEILAAVSGLPLHPGHEAALVDFDGDGGDIMASVKGLTLYPESENSIFSSSKPIPSVEVAAGEGALEAINIADAVSQLSVYPDSESTRAFSSARSPDKRPGGGASSGPSGSSPDKALSHLLSPSAPPKAGSGSGQGTTTTGAAVDRVLDCSHYEELLDLIQPLELSQALGDVLGGLKCYIISRQDFTAAMEEYLDRVPKTPALLEKGYPRIAVLVINRAAGRGPASFNDLDRYYARMSPSDKEKSFERNLTLKPQLVGDATTAARRDKMARRHHERMLGSKNVEKASMDRNQLLCAYTARYNKKAEQFKEEYDKERYHQCTFEPKFYTKSAREVPHLQKAAAKLKHLNNNKNVRKSGNDAISAHTLSESACLASESD